MEINQKIQLRKEGNEQSITYENNNTRLYRTLNEFGVEQYSGVKMSLDVSYCRVFCLDNLYY